MLRSSGREAFDSLLGRLPLTPSDEAVEEIAVDLGWSDEFMNQARAPPPVKASAPVPRSHDVAMMFRAQAAPVAPAAAPPVPAVRVPPPPAAVPKAAPAPARAPPAVPASAVPEPARPEFGPCPDGSGSAVAAVVPSDPAAPAPEPAAPAPEPVQEGINHAETGAPVAHPDPLICAICQDILRGSSGGEGGEECQAFPCGHLFHRECVTRWRQAANITTGGLRCPCCRTPVEDQDDLWDIIEVGPSGSNGVEASIL